MPLPERSERYSPSGGAITWTLTEAQGPGVYRFDVCVSDGLIK